MKDEAETTSAAASPDVMPTPSQLARVLEAILIVFLLIVLPDAARRLYRHLRAAPHLHADRGRAAHRRGGRRAPRGRTLVGRGWTRRSMTRPADPLSRTGSRALADGRVGAVTIRGLVSHIYFTFGHRQVW